MMDTRPMRKLRPEERWAAAWIRAALPDMDVRQHDDGSKHNAAKLSRRWESFELDGRRAGVGDTDVGTAFDPVGVVAGAFDDSRAGPHPRFGVEPVQHLGEDPHKNDV